MTPALILPPRRAEADGSGVLKIDGAGLAAIVILKLVGDALILFEAVHAGGLDGADVDESVVAAFFRRNEAVTLGGIEEFNFSDGHDAPFP